MARSSKATAISVLWNNVFYGEVCEASYKQDDEYPEVPGVQTVLALTELCFIGRNKHRPARSRELLDALERLNLKAMWKEQLLTMEDVNAVEACIKRLKKVLD